MCFIHFGSFWIVTVWGGRKGVKKRMALVLSLATCYLCPFSCLGFIFFIWQIRAVEDIEVLLWFRLYHSNGFPLNIWSHVHIMGWLGEIHSSLNGFPVSLTKLEALRGQGLRLLYL